MSETTFTQNADSNEVNSCKCNQTFTGLPCMLAGRVDAAEKSRLLLRFPIGSLPEAAEITTATLSLYAASTGIYNKNELSAFAVSEPWRREDVTWNNMPAYDSALYANTLRTDLTYHYDFDITAIVQGWQEGSIANNGLMLIGPEDRNCAFARVVTDPAGIYAPKASISYCKKPCCICQVSPTRFAQGYAEVTAGEAYTYTLNRDTSVTKTVTYLVENLGSTPVIVKLQISADGTSFAEDNSGVVVEPGLMAAAVPYIFAKYTRVGVKTAASGETSPVRIWYQAQI